MSKTLAQRVRALQYQRRSHALGNSDLRHVRTGRFGSLGRVVAVLIATIALHLGGGCAEVSVEFHPAPDAPTEQPTPEPEAPEAAPAPWYAHAVPSRPACRRLDAPTAASCVASFTDQESGECTTDPQFGDVSCQGGLFLQREPDGQLTAFVGDTFVAELEGSPQAMFLQGANGRQAVCDLAQVNPNVCVYGVPERGDR